MASGGGERRFQDGQHLPELHDAALEFSEHAEEVASSTPHSPPLLAATATMSRAHTEIERLARRIATHL